MLVHSVPCSASTSILLNDCNYLAVHEKAASLVLGVKTHIQTTPCPLFLNSSTTQRTVLFYFDFHIILQTDSKK